MHFTEMANHTYSLLQVLDYVKKNPVNVGEIYPLEIYYTFVGRHDQPDVYDKRPCLILKSFDNTAKVLKITGSTTGGKDRLFLKDYKEEGLLEPSEVRFDEQPYFINKNWLRTFVGDLSVQDMESVEAELEKRHI